MIWGQQGQQQKNILMVGTRFLERKMRKEITKIEKIIAKARSQKDLSQLSRFVDYCHSIDHVSWDEARYLFDFIKSMESKFTDSENQLELLADAARE